ncbi:MAG: hypothetical protein Q9182_004132 [Xanthomendoza sp. 2 TL-2023]
MAFASPGQNADLHRSKIFDVSHVVAVVTGGGSASTLGLAPSTSVENMSHRRKKELLPKTEAKHNLESDIREDWLIHIHETLVSNGAKVYVAELREEALKVGGRVCVIYISKKDKVAELVDRVTSAEPNGIQVLINNAGIARDHATEFAGNQPPDFKDPAAISKHFWKSDPESWKQNFTTNCMGGYFMAVGFLPLLAKGCGVIPGYTSSVINVTSNSAFLKNTTRGHISYGASKAGKNGRYGVLCLQVDDLWQ